MELEEKYEQLLLEIFEAVNQRILKAELSEKEKSRREYLEFLMEADLVEYDKKEAAFYLTYEGYEKVEEVKKLMEAGEWTANAAFEHILKKERQKGFASIIIGCFLMLGMYFTLSGTRSTPYIEGTKEGLEVLLNEIKEEIEMKTDSILNQH